MFYNAERVLFALAKFLVHVLGICDDLAVAEQNGGCSIYRHFRYI